MIFETKQDLINEEQVALKFADVGGFEYKKLTRDLLDYVLLKNGKGVCFLEIKCFKTNHDTYPTVLNSIYKWDKMMQFERLLPTYFACSYLDGKVLYIRATDIKGDIRWAGRKPRKGSANDMEACIFIPTNKMKTLNDL